jgi:hypothetical protein
MLPRRRTPRALPNLRQLREPRKSRAPSSYSGATRLRRSSIEGCAVNLEQYHAA